MIIERGLLKNDVNFGCRFIDDRSAVKERALLYVGRCEWIDDLLETAKQPCLAFSEQ